jgi:hypothetical protein
VHWVVVAIHGLVVASNTAVAFGVTLVPFSLEAPGSETLMARVVAGEMTVLYESLLVMATGNEVDLLVEAHLGRMGRWLLRLNWSGWVDCQDHGQCDKRAAYVERKCIVDVFEVLRCCCGRRREVSDR